MALAAGKCPRCYNREPPWKIVENLCLVKEIVHKVENFRCGGRARQVEHHDSRVLVRWVASDVGEVEVAR